jgi:hypothetical protein
MGHHGWRTLDHGAQSKRWQNFHQGMECTLLTHKLLQDERQLSVDQGSIPQHCVESLQVTGGQEEWNQKVSQILEETNRTGEFDYTVISMLGGQKGKEGGTNRRRGKVPEKGSPRPED